MCGIIGMLVKKESLRESLGRYVQPMVDCMESRGTDSAGLAVFRPPVSESERRVALQAPDQHYDWSAFEQSLREQLGCGDVRTVDNHAFITIAADLVGKFTCWLAERHPSLHLLSVGRCIEMYKDEGLPIEISRRFAFEQLSGTHAVGHTRMATESAVSPAHAHPYTAGEDFCLVHNGSLSNPYSVRRKLESRGIHFETDNDTEAGCRYLQWRMREGDDLRTAIESSFRELDGFFTFLMATNNQLVLVRDAFACKPAVVAETDDYVAVSSEFRSLAHLPDVSNARVFEPAPEQIYAWNV